MKCVLGIFLSALSLASALPNLVDLANSNNATTLTKFVDAAGLTDVLREQGIVEFNFYPADTYMYLKHLNVFFTLLFQFFS